MKNKDLLVSEDILNAVAKGKFFDKKFAETIRKEFKSDIHVLRNLDKVIWGCRL